MKEKAIKGKKTDPVSGGFLYVTAAVCGGAVLIVEILGAKMLSPYFGTSHFVWTAQIAVTLVSLAVGYWFGGRLADKKSGLHRLFLCILLAALYLCVTVPLTRPVAEKGLELRLALGSLLTSLFLFFVPLALLAAVGPFLVRVMTQSIQVVGTQVGRLTAISTLGSVAGTILIGYVLIPYFPNSLTMLGTAASLLVLVVVYVLAWNRKGGRAFLAILSALFGLGLGWWGKGAEARLDLPGLVELERRNSNFGLMQVVEGGQPPYRYYFNDFLCQNGMDPKTGQSVHLFTYMLHGLSRVYTPKIEKALFIGLGVGIVPMAMAEEGVQVDVVEINPAVVPLARRHFGFQPERVRLFFDDGRHFLNECRNRYDTVLLDAFLGDSSPSHLMTREAFAAVRRVLNPGGTLVVNSFGNLSPGRDFLTASLEKTLRSVFRSVVIHAEDPEGNIFFVAADRPELKFLHDPPDELTVHPSLRKSVRAALNGRFTADPARGRVLTDDFNPVDYYDAANREQIRRELARNLLGGR